MFFTTTAAFALAAASLAMAQDATTTLTQCAQSTINFAGFAGTSGPYYVAVLNGADPCGNDAIAEFYDVSGQSVDYTVTLPAGTQVQTYVVDANNQEFWGPVMTVADGDASCLNGGANNEPSSPSESATPSAPAASYTPPNAATTPSGSGSSTHNTPSTGGSVSDNNNFDTPANAAEDTTDGASTITASTTLIVGALVAAVALF